MSQRTNKIHKTVRFDSDVFEAIENYKKLTGKDRSAAIESLILAGLENIDRQEEIEKKLISRMNRIEQKQKQDTDRIVNLIIGLTRIQGRNYGLEKLLVQNLLEDSKETVLNAENYGIKYVMKDLKWREQGVQND